MKNSNSLKQIPRKINKQGEILKFKVKEQNDKSRQSQNLVNEYIGMIKNATKRRNNNKII